MSPSPAERYAISREQRRKPRLVDFASRLRFDLDPFQTRRVRRARRGQERARRRADRGRQDRRGRVRRLPRHAGARATRCSTRRRSRRSATRSSRSSSTSGVPTEVGLLTGDTNMNSGARIVVMTTEVLRNMLYADSPLLDRPRLRGHGRGALPRRPLPRRRVGGGHHPPPRGGAPRLAVGDRVECRGVRRLAAGRARRHRRDRLRGPARAARAARAREGASCSTCSTPRGRRPRTG